MLSQSSLVLNFPDPDRAAKARVALTPSGRDGSAIVYYLADHSDRVRDLVEDLTREYGTDLTATALDAVGVNPGTVYSVDDIVSVYLSGRDGDDGPTRRFKDAEIWGEMSEEVFNLPIAISTAENRYEKEWKTTPEVKFGELFNGTFAEHKIGKKEGRCFVTGTLGKSKRRTKNNVLKNYLVGIDVDSGASMEDCFQRVRAAGLTCIFYSTHSHESTGIEIAQDRFHRWAEKSQIDPTPTTEAIRRYMREEMSYVDSVVNAAEFIEKRQEDGMKLIIQTNPIPKFRMLFPLAQPFVYAEQDGAHKDVINLWSQKVLGLARSFGVEADPAARDPSRLFYLPRHDKGAENFRIMLTCGRLLKFEDIPVANLRRAGDGREFVSPNDGINLKKWARDRAHGFDIAQVFKDHCHDKVRSEQSDTKYTVDCPFDDNHSNPGDPDDQGCFVQSAGADAETFSFHCSHAGCADHDRLSLMQKAMQEGWFPESVLTDPNYDLAGIDDEVDSTCNNAPITTDAHGKLTFHAKRTKFKRKQREGRDWFFGPDAEGNDVAACQAFRVTHVASDMTGGGAAITIQFQPLHSQAREVTFARAELYNKTEVLGRLVDKWFSVANERITLDLLKALELPIDTTIVDRSGWHEGAFLHPSGETVSAPVVRMGETAKLRLRGGAPAGDWRGGTLEGWKAAVALAFDDDARGREQFALGVMAGCAGVVAGFVGMSGFPILNLHGNTSRGKSTALKLAASASGAAHDRGAYQGLRKTDNGMEGILSSRSGITLAIDEGKATNADTLDSVVWMMAEGMGKTRATVTGEARATKQFAGFAMTANEVPLAQMLAQARKTQPGGFHARVCDVDVSSVAELTGTAKDHFFASIAGIKVHYGHAWELVARHLQSLGFEHVAPELDRLAKELVGPDADAFTTRSAKALALVWYSGIVMQQLGLIPTCEFARVVRWAWGTRAVESTLDPFTRAMETLLTNVATRRGVDIYEWSTIEERRYREAVGFIFMDGIEELLLVPRDRLAELCGGHMSGNMVRDQMAARDLLGLSGKKNPKPRWSNLPDGQALSHYRIKLVELANYAAD
ncbi:DUF927 domain-containing protein [Mesorhizobium sp. B2-5-9]|uniref:DUF927 domain-containing protein n=1 Tax=Mesorhizobium sp. B2-5-9 TaxID=2589921 RepID=UPI0011275C91|nr:DUF927 domain-containing protein [Mesorhizobium sp. B2-5-9]TPK05248.1 DUF927 domain-containing protein [Mesorhizobium sp. B2-5-9]